MQPVFVTGATGFLGAHLVCALLQKGHYVNALKRAQSSMNEFTFISGLYFGHDQSLVINNLKWMEGDITDYDSIEPHFEKDQVVYHCAAVVSFNRNDHKRLLLTNVKGTENVANACLYKKVNKLIYVSSTAAVGKANDDFLTSESDFWDEKDHPTTYSTSKYYAELEVWRAIEEGLNAVIVNPPIIIGPCNWEKSTGRFFINGFKNFPFYTNGSNAFVYVNDLVKVMMALSESEISGQRFLVVGENMSYRTFMDSIADAFGKKKPFLETKPFMIGIAWRWFELFAFITGKKGLITEESAAGSLKRIFYSNQKIKAALQFEFTPVKDAVIETVKIFKQSYQVK